MTKSLLQVTSGIRAERTPIWFMRQAGRYLPEFHEVKRRYSSFFEVCMSPEAVLEITMQPLKRFDLDAAILFSDILMVPYIMGADISFAGNGPEVDISNLHKKSRKDEAFAAVSKALRLIRAEIDKNYPHVALIGFAGAPWTVACYMVEGKISKDFHKVKGFAYSSPEKFSILINDLTEITIEYLKMQVESGAEIIKIFDSWAGMLPPDQFARWVIEPTKRIVKALKDAYPDLKIIGFPRGAGLMYVDYVSNVEVDVVALDQYVPLAWAKKVLNGIALQGNLDNILLASSLEQAVTTVKETVGALGTGRFIFNLGHGVIPSTPIQNIEAIIMAIRNYGITV